MVRRKRGSRRDTREPSIWEMPRIQQMLAEPVGSPVDLTRAEAEAIVRDAIKNPPDVDKKSVEREHRELRRLRRESGALLIRPDKDA